MATTPIDEGNPPRTRPALVVVVALLLFVVAISLAMGCLPGMKMLFVFRRMCSFWFPGDARICWFFSHVAFSQICFVNVMPVAALAVAGLLCMRYSASERRIFVRPWTWLLAAGVAICTAAHVFFWVVECQLGSDMFRCGQSLVFIPVMRRFGLGDRVGNGGVYLYATIANLTISLGVFAYGALASLCLVRSGSCMTCGRRTFVAISTVVCCVVLVPFSAGLGVAGIVRNDVAAIVLAVSGVLVSGAFLVLWWILAGRASGDRILESDIEKP